MTAVDPVQGPVCEDFSFLAAAGEAWMALTPDGTIAAINDAARQTFGWDAQTVVGRPLAEFLSADVRAGHLRHIALAAAGDLSFLGPRFRTKIPHCEGHEIPAEISMSASGEGDDLRFHVFIRDISELRHLERYVIAQRAVSRLLLTDLPIDLLVDEVTLALMRTLEGRRCSVWRVDPVAGTSLERCLEGGDIPRPACADRLLAQARATGVLGFSSACSDGETTPTLRTGLWIPVRYGGGHAVLELFSEELAELQPVYRDMINELGRQVGDVIDGRHLRAEADALAAQNRRILEASSEGIVGLTRDAHVTVANAAAAAVLGRPVEELVGSCIHEIAHGDSRHTREECPLVLASKSASRVHGEDDHFCVHGALRTIEFSLVPLPGPAEDDGVGTVFTFHDVTTTRELEAARTHDLTFLQSLLDSMEEGVAACDAAGNFTLFNRALRAMGPQVTDIDAADRPQHYGLRDPVTGQLLEEDQIPMVRALRGEVVRDQAVALTDARGEPRLVHCNAVGVTDREGTRLGAVVVLRDSSELQAAQQRMNAAERLAGAGSWEIDLLANTVSWSDGLFVLFGRRPGSVTPTWELVSSHLHPEDASDVWQSMQEAVASGVAGYSHRHRIYTVEDDLRYVTSTAEILRGADGTPTRVRGTTQDITARALAERNLRRDEARGRQVDRMESLGQLAGGIAHDFNNLLAVILTYSEFVLEDIEDGRSRGDVGEIRRAAQRAADLTRRLLVFSRREVTRPELLDVGGLLVGLSSLLERTLGEHLEIALDIGAELPPVRADAGQLEQIIINLSLNARDAMPDGGTLRIAVDPHEISTSDDLDVPPGSYLRIRVSDTGTGMAPEVAQHAFEPFFTTKAKGRGTGLGLATVYGAVSEAGGAISVHSELDQGAQFTIMLPAADEEATDDGPADSGWARMAAHSSGARILVVEDDDAVRRATCRILRDAGYTVDGAETGEAAIEVLETSGDAVCLLLTDVVMPGMSGWELHKRVAERWPRIPTLFMSGYTDDLLATGDIVGDVEFIAKPFAGPELLAAVRAHARLAS